MTTESQHKGLREQALFDAGGGGGGEGGGSEDFGYIPIIFT